MTDETEIKRGPGRPTNAEIAARAVPPGAEESRVRPERAEEVKTRRRRREGLGEDRNLKLYVPGAMKDPNFAYRFVNDRPGRVRQMTVEDDWDVVKDERIDSDSIGTVPERVGDKITGERMTLLRKPKELFDEDRKEKFKALDKTEASMRRELPTTAGGLSAQDNPYIPTGKNIVGGR